MFNEIVQDYVYSPLRNEDSLSLSDDNSSLDGSSEKNEKEMDFDGLLKHTVGEFGRYQQLIVWILCIPTCFLSAFSTFDMIFIAYTPQFNCSLPKDHPNFIVDSKQQCDYIYINGSYNQSFKCHSFDYDKEYFQQSIVTQWNLVCDEALAARTIISLLNLATLIAVSYSYVQDRWGRKKAFLLNLFIFLCGSVGSVNATNPIMFAVLKFIGGISCMWEIGFVWALEFVGPSKRTLVTTILSVVYGVANMSLALLAWLTQTWVVFGFCTSAPFALLFMFTCFMPESPRWLIAEGRIEETAEIIEKMASWEKKDVDPAILRKQLIALKNHMDKESALSKSQTISVWDFFRSKNLLFKNLLLTFIGVAGNQLYYAVAYDSENLYPNFYVAYILQAAVEAPATFLNLLLLNRFGRIVPLSFSLLLSGLFCLLTWPMSVFSSWHLGIVILTTVSRFFVSAGVAIIEQLGGELYPTVGRGIGLSVSYVASSLAAVSIQYLIYASIVWNILPLLIMGSCTLVAGFMTLFLPETKDKSLPDTIQQAEAQGAVGWESFRGHFPYFYSRANENSVLVDKTI